MKKKKNVLSRYELDSNGSPILDVSAERVEDLYNDFDKSAPYVRRDLDQDLADYLLDCAREISRHDFTLRFTLKHPPGQPQTDRIRRSVNNYFMYLAEVERREVMRMFRRSGVLFTIGLGIFAVSVYVNQLFGTRESALLGDVFAEGLTVAAWVALWEALAIFLIGWFPHHKNILLFKKLASSPVIMRSADDGSRTAPRRQV